MWLDYKQCVSARVCGQQKTIRAGDRQTTRLTDRDRAKSGLGEEEGHVQTKVVLSGGMSISVVVV